MLYIVLNAVMEDFDYVFSENGLVAYKKGELLAVQSLRCVEWKRCWDGEQDMKGCIEPFSGAYAENFMQNYNSYEHVLMDFVSDICCMQ